MRRGGRGGGGYLGGGEVCRGSARLTNKYVKLLSFFLLKKGEEKRDLHEQYNNILVCK